MNITTINTTDNRRISLQINRSGDLEVVVLNPGGNYITADGPDPESIPAPAEHLVGTVRRSELAAVAAFLEGCA